MFPSILDIGFWKHNHAKFIIEYKMYLILYFKNIFWIFLF
jgi:hypothetical protein